MNRYREVDLVAVGFDLRFQLQRLLWAAFDEGWPPDTDPRWRQIWHHVYQGA